MGTNSGTRTQTAVLCGTAIFLLAVFAAIAITGPRRAVRSCLSAWTAWVSEWRSGKEARNPAEERPDMDARLEAMSENLDRVRQEARPWTMPSATALQAEVSNLRTEVDRLQHLVHQHEQGMQVVRETLDQIAQCQRRTR